MKNQMTEKQKTTWQNLWEKMRMVTEFINSNKCLQETIAENYLKDEN